MIPDVMLAKSLAGHDKNHIYVINGTEEDFYFLINGDTKTVSKPKKKKRMHVQEIKHLPSFIIELLEDEDCMSDELAKKILVRYQEERNCQKQM